MNITEPETPICEECGVPHDWFFSCYSVGKQLNEMRTGVEFWPDMNGNDVPLTEEYKAALIKKYGWPPPKQKFRREEAK